MTSAEIRSSFLDFFKSKQHAIVPSSSLMPTAPNLWPANPKEYQVTASSSAIAMAIASWAKGLAKTHAAPSFFAMCR
jgi:hypothetical protein